MECHRDLTLKKRPHHTLPGSRWRRKQTKIVTKDKTTYVFSSKTAPIERVRTGESVLLKTEDAFGGQITTENAKVDALDWSRVNGATGPIFVEGAEPGDTLVTEILNVKTEKRGVIAAIPKHGVLGKKQFRCATRQVQIRGSKIHFGDSVWLNSEPMIGTIGVAPAEGEIPTGFLGRHGGNMDVKDTCAGAKLYLPVFVKGALFAAGDLHAVQADGELCVSAIEAAGEVLLNFQLLKHRTPEWPVLETKREYAILACGESLDEAAESAADAATRALMREYGWPFEEAYMFGSLAVDLRINQVVDPLKGVRAVISKDFVGLKGLLEPRTHLKQNGAHAEM